MTDTVLDFKDGFDFVRLLDKIPEDFKKTWEVRLRSGSLKSKHERELLGKLNWVIGWGMDNFRRMNNIQYNAFKAAWHQLVGEIDECLSKGKSIPLSHYTAQAFGKGVWWQKGHDDAVNWTKERIDRFLRPAKRVNRPSERTAISLLCLAEYKAGAHVQIQSVRTTEESNQITEWTEAAKNLVKDVAWSKLEDSDFRFPWFDKLRESNDILLARLGVMYEYAREATKLKHLFALLETKEQFPSLSTIRAEFDGLDEPTVEKTLSAFYSPLRKLRHFLINNFSFQHLFEHKLNELNATMKKSFDPGKVDNKLKNETVSYHWPYSGVSLRFDGEKNEATTFEDCLPHRERRFISDDDGPYAENLVIRINWNETDQFLLDSFQKFLHNQRPKNLIPEPQSKTGRGHSEYRTLKKELTYLATMRLVNYFPIDQVPQKLNRFDVETSDLYTRAKQSRLFFKKLFPFESGPIHRLTNKTRQNMAR